MEWDAIIIGTGMGGAPLGYALAKAGQRVLFLEKGKSQLRPGALTNSYAETHFPAPAAPGPQHRATLQRAGRYSDTIRTNAGPRTQHFVPFIGSGTGGSSALYGMVLERFFPADFAPRAQHPGAADAALPAAWPIGYAALLPHYAEAEQLFRVRGTPDPLRADPGGDWAAHFRAPPPLTPAAGELFAFFAQRALHPYRLPLACEFVDGCAACQGYLCDRACKNDASRVCLQPALAQHGATLMDECEVVQLEATRAAVTGVVCEQRGQRLTLRGKQVFLAAGALETPRLLLQSRSAHWPQGLANDSGLVGRNLMRHHIDLYLIKPNTPAGFDNRQKEFGFNDFYQRDGIKLGSVQSFGRLPPVPVLAASMADDIRQGALPWLAPLFTLAQPVLRPVLKQFVHERLVLATTLEDLPYADNRVTPASGDARLALDYRVRPHDAARIAAMRRLMKDALKPYAFDLVKQADNNQRIAHVCGTCRFGSDPRNSVLDANNRAHGLSNLYVVDGSFFPSSGGTNPSLTIAANALRVARHLTGKGLYDDQA
ncbi:Choline dehydrogenase [Duganella sp. CF458]|uniref:GMC oxidoreductase n=1 Tax=Duganella sp. CF458 TaxID=1884368 RepID=UPI0008EF9408|nr:GMC family oxidoreductase [Duganella sp. CF458]SFF70347.1 Choline dehydrogenase [Duganella sp. CF458]